MGHDAPRAGQRLQSRWPGWVSTDSSIGQELIIPHGVNPDEEPGFRDYFQGLYRNPELGDGTEEYTPFDSNDWFGTFVIDEAAFWIPGTIEGEPLYDTDTHQLGDPNEVLLIGDVIYNSDNPIVNLPMFQELLPRHTASLRSGGYKFY